VVGLIERVRVSLRTLTRLLIVLRTFPMLYGVKGWGSLVPSMEKNGVAVAAIVFRGVYKEEPLFPRGWWW
jgi:hypothetical protein